LVDLVSSVQQLSIPEEDKKKVLGGNLAKLLRLPDGQ